jgi:hypothetical protein
MEILSFYGTWPPLNGVRGSVPGSQQEVIVARQIARSPFIPANVLSEGSRSPTESSILFLFETDFAGG